MIGGVAGESAQSSAQDGARWVGGSIQEECLPLEGQEGLANAIAPVGRIPEAIVLIFERAGRA